MEVCGEVGRLAESVAGVDARVGEFVELRAERLHRAAAIGGGEFAEVRAHAAQVGGGHGASVPRISVMAPRSSTQAVAPSAREVRPAAVSR